MTEKEKRAPFHMYLIIIKSNVTANLQNDQELVCFFFFTNFLKSNSNFAYKFTYPRVMDLSNKVYKPVN